MNIDSLQRIEQHLQHMYNRLDPEKKIGIKKIFSYYVNPLNKIKDKPKKIFSFKYVMETIFP